MNPKSNPVIRINARFLYWPNNHGKEEAYKIFVSDEMVWNLIEKNKEYFSSYSKEGDTPWI